MTFEINVQNDAGYSVDTEFLQLAAKTVLSAHDVVPQSGLTIVITDNDAVRALNCQYRDIDAPTDVLSFPAENPPAEINDEPPYLGDLIIAYPYASAQAEREGHALHDSLSLLVVHGTLHLLGYDHDTLENKAAMWSAQETALAALGISSEIVPPLESSSHDE